MGPGYTLLIIIFELPPNTGIIKHHLSFVILNFYFSQHSNLIYSMASIFKLSELVFII